MKPVKFILPIIVIAQFFCTSLWFAGNAVLGDLVKSFNLDTTVVGHLTSAVQFGFIIGTLIFALFTVSDRYSPSKVFLFCALLGACFNLGTTLNGNSFINIVLFRFLTGFCLAGIYPVGMKIAADYFEKGLGKSLGFLVGALVLGTALPHLLKDLTHVYSWRVVMLSTSLLSVIGGLLMVVFVPDGPFRKPGTKLDLTATFSVFKNTNFRAAAFGYFGHMWELYTFWAFVPFIIQTYININQTTSFNISLITFFVIGIGSLSCIIGGYISNNKGSQYVAFHSLLCSGLCCLLSPFIFMLNEYLFIIYLLFWGIVVIADSPQFSTLVAQNTSYDTKGTALTIVNCIGFAVTIISIQLVSSLQNTINPKFIYLILILGPILGLIALKQMPKKH
ncbi:MFS transporter [Aestuariibaculum sediminum]|uniref:MFS transporter n=1 Tax=Aestuariibaculum sediminum TaxID=2770637 RepID=A0A8J6Q2G0_9FLAO|nr:MFS transporter [Aestuariibaculum sediminum]MBD0833602.1 MFS transporter [Aestuariibaculum sediminum]